MRVVPKRITALLLAGCLQQPLLDTRLSPVTVAQGTFALRILHADGNFQLWLAKSLAVAVINDIAVLRIAEAVLGVSDLTGELILQKGT
jgi:hypothetical protein